VCVQRVGWVIDPATSATRIHMGAKQPTKANVRCSQKNVPYCFALLQMPANQTMSQGSNEDPRRHSYPYPALCATSFRSKKGKAQRHVWWNKRSATSSLNKGDDIFSYAAMSCAPIAAHRTCLLTMMELRCAYSTPLGCPFCNVRSGVHKGSVMHRAVGRWCMTPSAYTSYDVLLPSPAGRGG
jgi:hypothetical protein